MAQHIYDITTTIEDPTEVPSICTKVFPLAFLSAASGTKNKLIIIHSIYQGQFSTEQHVLGLTGTSIRPSVLELLPTQLFKVVKANVPSLNYFLDLEDSSSIPIPQSDQITQTDISYSIALNPAIAKLLMPIEDLSANTAYEKVLQFCLDEDKPLTDESTTSDDESSFPFDRNPQTTTRESIKLLQHLYYFAHLTSARQQGFKFASNRKAINYLLSMEQNLKDGKVHHDENDSDNDDDTAITSNANRDSDSHPSSGNNSDNNQSGSGNNPSPTLNNSSIPSHKAKAANPTKRTPSAGIPLNSRTTSPYKPVYPNFQPHTLQ
jgi:hypothetical protein